MDSYFEKINRALPYEPFVSSENKNFSFLSHHHEETEIIYVTGGKMLVKAKNMSVTLEKGDIFIVAPNTIHSMTSYPESSNYIFKFYSPDIIFSYDVTQKIPRSCPNYAVFCDIVNKITEEYRKKAPGYGLVISALSNMFLANAVRLLDSPEITAPDMVRNRKKAELLKKVTAYLEEHYDEEITLFEISAECGYSRHYFSHIFKEITSMSFPDFVSLFRIKKAQNMLRSGVSISASAFDSGFNNLRSFNRAFKKHTGTTPTKWLSAK